MKGTIVVAMVTLLALAVLSMPTVLAASDCEEDTVPLVTIFDWQQERNLRVDDVSRERFLELIENQITLKFSGLSSKEEALCRYEAAMAEQIRKEEERAQRSGVDVYDQLFVKAIYDPFMKRSRSVRKYSPAELKALLLNDVAVEMSGLKLVDGRVEHDLAVLEAYLQGSEPSEAEEAVAEAAEMAQGGVAEETEETQTPVEEEPVAVDEEQAAGEEEAVLLKDVVCADDMLTFVLTNPEAEPLHLDPAEVQRLRDEGDESASALFFFINDKQIKTLTDLCGVSVLGAGQAVECSGDGDVRDLLNPGKNDVSAFSPETFTQVAVECTG
ncbi:hypothetical protein D6783_00380 [Candidatus Woesearchaeota archaeon]|nr:MAG: hypothetical protein D6783_00380 [Candidatus Woesearchaeota archaeon]